MVDASRLNWDGLRGGSPKGRLLLDGTTTCCWMKLHPDGRNVSTSVGKVPSVEADVDARNLESAIGNLLLNACQAATCSSHAPEVKVHLMEVDERICVAISDNGPGIPASIRRTLFDLARRNS
jgi:C4-dicarboxylate-specific signal transduction histidine kinase